MSHPETLRSSNAPKDGLQRRPYAQVRTPLPAILYFPIAAYMPVYSSAVARVRTNSHVTFDGDCRHMKWPKMREGTSKELTNFVNALIDVVQDPGGSGRQWETISSPDFSDHSSLNNNGHHHSRSSNGEHHSSGSGGPSSKSARISTKTAVNIVALAIAR